MGVFDLMGNERIAADVLIVGAGMTGLMAAQTLTEQGIQVLVLEKASSVGGRLATRRIGGGRADQGAQFFTARTPEFNAWIQRWMDLGLVYEWSSGWSDGSLHRAPSNGHPRYAVQNGMTTLAKHLAAEFDVRLDTEITHVAHAVDGWELADAAGNRYTGRALVLTPPVPQGLDLIGGVEDALSLDELATLTAITYAPSLTGLFWVEGSLYLPAPGAIQRPDMPIVWIADNQRKGISPEACVLTVQAGTDMSKSLWPMSDNEILISLEQVFAFFMGPDAMLRDAQLKRWRYAAPEHVVPERFLWATQGPPLIFAGDAFGGPRIEGAALSGLATGLALARQLQAG